MPFYYKENPSVESIKKSPLNVNPNIKKSVNDAERKSFQNTDELISRAEKAANESNGAFTIDDAKYALASELAQNNLGQADDVNDDALKQEIDRIFENDLKGTVSGRDYRGENFFTDFVGGAKNAINGFNQGIGEGIDFLVDNTIGEAVGVFGGDKEGFKNATRAEDFAMIPDIAEDILLASLGPAGIAMAVGKNAIQQSDNISEALSGRDNVTTDTLSGEQRIGKGATAALTTGLSAVPGVGKAAMKSSFLKNGATAEQAAEEAAFKNMKLGDKIKEANRVAKETAQGKPGYVDKYREIQKAQQDTKGNLAALKLLRGNKTEEGKKLAQETAEAIGEARDKALAASAEYGAMRPNKIQAAKDWMDTMSRGSVMRDADRWATKQKPIKKKAMKHGPLKGSLRPTAGAAFAPMANVSRILGNYAGANVIGATNNMGEYGGNFGENLVLSNRDLSGDNPADLGRLLLTVYPKGIGTKRVPSIRGKKNTAFSKVLPGTALNTAAYGNVLENEEQHFVDRNNALSEEEILRQIRKSMGY